MVRKSLVTVSRSHDGHQALRQPRPNHASAKLSNKASKVEYSLLFALMLMLVVASRRFLTLIRGALARRRASSSTFLLAARRRHTLHCFLNEPFHAFKAIFLVVASLVFFWPLRSWRS